MEIVLEHAYLYAKKVAEYLGNEITYYQLGNELNHPWDQMPGEYDAAFMEALARGIIDGDPNIWFTIVNAFADWKNWDYILTNWLKSAGYIIDIVAIDHYPGTWTSSGYNDWTALDKLIEIASLHYKVPAIMETGFPSTGGGHSESEQARYVDSAFNAIMQKAQNYYIAFLSWYMLWDEPSSNELWYSGWGVLRGNFSKKPAWYKLEDWFKNKLR